MVQGREEERKRPNCVTLVSLVLPWAKRELCGLGSITLQAKSGLQAIGCQPLPEYEECTHVLYFRPSEDQETQVFCSTYNLSIDNR